MRSPTSEAVLILVGMVGATLSASVSVSWILQGRLTSIEVKLESVPKIEARVEDLSTRVSKQDLSFQLLDQRVKDFEQPIKNTQANVKGLIRQVDQLKQGQVVASPYHMGPYGSR